MVENLKRQAQFHFAIGDSGIHTKINKCIPEGKVIFDVENNDIAQIHKADNLITYEYADAIHIRIIDKENINLENLYTIRVYDLKNIDLNAYYEIETYNNYVRLKKDSHYNEEFLGYSINENRLNVDYINNDNSILIINNLNTLVNDKNEFSLYEVWKRHNIIYDLNGGSLKDGDTLDGIKSVMYGVIIQLPTVIPVKDNYTFGGWSQDKNDIYGRTDKLYYKNDLGEEDYTIYAVWVPNWLANATEEAGGYNSINYTANIVGQEELDEFIKINPYLPETRNGKLAKYIINVSNNNGAQEDLKINTELNLKNTNVSVIFNSNIILNADIIVDNGSQNKLKVNKVAVNGGRNKVGFTGTGSIILKKCYEFYIGNTLYLGTSKSAGIYGGTIVLSKDQETDELILEVKSGTAVIKNNDFGNVGIDFSFTIDYKLIIDEGAKLEVSKSAGVTGEIQNNGTLQINSGYNLTIKQGGRYTQGENGEITGTGNFIQQ